MCNVNENIEDVYTAHPANLKLMYIKKRLSGEDPQIGGYDFRNPFEIAAEQGLLCEIPDSYTLQVDIDDVESYTHFRKQLTEIEKKTGFHFKPYHIKPSKSGGHHFHITLTTDKKMSVWQRIALQMVLGSDIKRERLNALRVLKYDPVPIAFFEKE